MNRSAAAALVRRFLRDVSGTTAIEYTLMAAGIGGTIAVTVHHLGSEIKTTLYDKIAAMF
jgi:Flp pilus assembly pilin Flp